MTLNFRPLTPADFPLFADWLARPHVALRWKDPKPNVPAIAAEYAPGAEDYDKTAAYIVMDGDKPIGMIQSFLLASYPEYDQLFSLRGALSIDYFIGEEDYIGRGYGARMIRDFIQTVARRRYPDATGVTTAAEESNLASLGALKAVGFEPGDIIEGDYGPERVMTLRY